MAFIITPYRSRIADLCREYRVRRLDLFGSALGEEFSSDSDVDFMVEFLDRQPEGAVDRYFGLRDALQATLQRPVDLVMRDAVRNPYFLRTVQDGQFTIYAD